MGNVPISHREAMWDAITFAGINHILFDSSLKTSDYSEDHVFTIDNIKEKLYSPSFDRNAHHRNTPVILEEKEFFGEWVRNPQLSEHGLLKFRDLGTFDIINVSAICRNVGFLRLSNNEFYIIDQENRIKFR
ncbi:hypothetical protein C2G38_2154543 [Gigaspora rosea]|uniref:Uncharacterized protein n=1 Tax=Gigaspora rosea TaxID=44941 RepID=A0A397W6M8_9GLOM|nr:hypothetical protein C2G38_2154543 [Gigaspora rosea]